VLAQPYSFGWGRTQQQEYASARRDGIAVAENASITNVELRLTKAGSIEGIVRLSSGEPAAGALVIARDENGQMAQGYMAWNQRADETGHYSISNLAPGTWTLSAKTDRESLLDGATTRVTASSRATLDLALRPGTRLEVSVEESDGKKVGASLSLVDARGRDLSDVLVRPGTELGPVPPGRYTLRATNHSGASVETEVDLHGEERREVTLRFAGGE
jgi:hypothetical protein